MKGEREREKGEREREKGERMTADHNRRTKSGEKIARNRLPNLNKRNGKERFKWNVTERARIIRYP